MSKGTAEGANAGWPSAAGICRPGWLICIHICTPRERAASAQAMKRSRWRSSSSTTPPGPVMARPSTITLPVMISPAPPSAQRWYNCSSASEGAWSASAMFSSIAALAMRLRMRAPEGSARGENSDMGQLQDRGMALR